MEHYNLKRMIMKKSIILLAMVLGAFTANAQSVVEGTKLTDNWSVEGKCQCNHSSYSTALSLRMHALDLELGFQNN